MPDGDEELKEWPGLGCVLMQLTRHRTVMDYRQSLLEADELEFVNLR